MKKIGSLIIFISLACCAAALAQAKPPETTFRHDNELPKIKISDLKWEKTLKKPLMPPLGAGSSPPSSSGRTAEIVNSNPVPLGGLPVIYRYQAIIENGGDKKIQLISWEYVFSDLESGKELNRRKLQSFDAIKPGKKAVVKMNSSIPPTNLVTVKSIEKDSRSPYQEKAEIRCVVYSDNSMWTRADVSPEECAAFYQERKYYKRRLF